MKKKEELIAMGKVAPTPKNVLERLFYQGEISDCMQLRCIDEEGYSVFQCGIDVKILGSDSPIVITTLGVWGCSFRDLVRNLLKLEDNHLNEGYCWFITDDSKNVYGDKYEYDENGDYYLASPSTAREHIITDAKTIEKLTRGLEEIG